MAYASERLDSGGAHQSKKTGIMRQASTPLRPAAVFLGVIYPTYNTNAN